MNTTHTITRIIAGALLSGAAAVAGLGLSAGTAQAFNPQPDPPGRPVAIAVNPQPEKPGGSITIGVNPQQQQRPQIAVHGAGA